MEGLATRVIVKAGQSEPIELPLDAVFRVAYEQSAVGICVSAPTGEFLHANRAFCELVGYSIDELRTLRTYDLTHPDDRRRALDIMERMQRGDISETRWERRFIHKSGLALWTLLTTTAVRPDDGDVGYCISQVIDITDRKLAEDALQRAEARFRALIGAMQDVIIVLDRDGTYADIAPSAADKLFRSPAELLGRRLVDVFPPELAAEFLGFIHRALDTQAPVETSYSLDIRGERVWFDATISPLPDNRVVWVARDVTARHRAEIALRESENQLRQSQKMDAVGQLAGGIAHDFNNLLMAIISNAELAILDLPADSPTHANIDEIKLASRRARELTQQLLAFSRKQVLQPRVLALNAVVLEAEQMLRRLIGETITMAVALDPQAGFVRADPGQLTQVLVNLCVNARDAMTDGGQLTIDSANREVTAAEAATYRGLRPGSYVVLQVRDTGVGMDERTSSRVFEPFFTTKPPGKGTGLGLSTAYGIVKQSGGYIAVESTQRAGSTFSVFLPRVTGDEQAAAPATQPAPAKPTAVQGSATILLVEDEAAVREAAKRMLKKYGFTVIEAKNGQDALMIWEQHADEIDLVLTDVVMPTLGGAQLVEALRVRRPSLRVVFMSGYTQGTLELSSLDEGATRFLPKPFTADQLIGTLRELLPE